MNVNSVRQDTRASLIVMLMRPAVDEVTAPAMVVASAIMAMWARDVNMHAMLKLTAVAMDGKVFLLHVTFCLGVIIMFFSFVTGIDAMTGENASAMVAIAETNASIFVVPIC